MIGLSGILWYNPSGYSVSHWMLEYAEKLGGDNGSSVIFNTSAWDAVMWMWLLAFVIVGVWFIMHIYLAYRAVGNLERILIMLVIFVFYGLLGRLNVLNLSNSVHLQWASIAALIFVVAGSLAWSVHRRRKGVFGVEDPDTD